MMMNFIAGVLIISALIALYHTDALNTFFKNWRDFSTQYPRDVEDVPAWPFDDFYINWSIVSFVLGMIVVGAANFFFMMVMGTYQNKLIREDVDAVYNTYLEEKVERIWEWDKLKTRQEEYNVKSEKIKKVARYELFGSFWLIMLGLWGFYDNWGFEESHPVYGQYYSLNNSIGFVLLAFLLLWALFFSPLLHYKFEKGVTYRKKHETMGWVLLEERGIGSYKKFWTERIKDPISQRVLLVINLLTVLGLIGNMILYPDVVHSAAKDILKISLTDYMAASIIVYIFTLLGLFVYSVKILRFDDIHDPERGKKRIYSVVFLIFLFGLIIGVLGMYQDYGEYLALYVQFFNANSALSIVKIILFLGLFLVILNVFWFPFFIKFENLYDTIPDLFKIISFGIIFLLTMNYMNEWYFDIGSGLTHPSWNLGDDVISLREDFHWGIFMVRMHGYHYWGWIQELLFLSYFCWLSWKAFPNNKYVNAVISAILFALFHWVNMPLMLATGVGGLLWAVWFGEKDDKDEFNHRNIFMLGLMHGFNGSLVDMLVPMSMNVGPRH